MFCSRVDTLKGHIFAPTYQRGQAIICTKHTHKLNKNIRQRLDTRFPHQLVVQSTANSPLQQNNSNQEQQTTLQPPTESFQWNRCWYPVTALEYLDHNPAQPKQVTILGTDLVVWKDRTNTWTVFRDSCPHRAAPLSEGRVNPKTGNLECAYHGWQFKSGTGACCAIPQSEPGPATATALQSKRSCATVYPSAVSNGLLWVWMDPTEQGRAISETSSLPEIPLTDGLGRNYFPVSSWYVRALDVDYMAVLDNTADPVHVHFTHAGFIGAPDRAGPVSVSVVKEVDDGNGITTYVMVCDDPKKQSFHDLVLKPPCMLWAASEGMDGGELGLLYFVVPVAPGRSRLMSLPLSTNPKFKTVCQDISQAALA